MLDPEPSGSLRCRSIVVAAREQGVLLVRQRSKQLGLGKVLPHEQSGSPRRGGPLFVGNVGPRVAQVTFTWMLFGFASGFFGRWMRSTPCFDSARIFSESMVAGSEKARVNVP